MVTTHYTAQKLVPRQPALSEQQLNIDVLVQVVTIVRFLVLVQMACIQTRQRANQGNAPSVGRLAVKRIEWSSKPIFQSVFAHYQPTAVLTGGRRASVKVGGEIGTGRLHKKHAVMRRRSTIIFISRHARRVKTHISK